MKPLHVGLLVIGAALAGGVAVRMTQPPPLPAPSAAPPVVAPVRQKPAGTQPQTPAVVEQTATAPQPAADPDSAPTPAPPPVYRPPVKRPVQKKSVENKAPARAVERKPVEVAKLDPVPPLRPAPYQEPAPVAAPEPDPQPAVTAAPDSSTIERQEPALLPLDPPRQVTLRAGMPISVRLLQTLSSDHLVAGDTFQATLSEPLVVDGLAIAEKGARVSGRVIDSRKAGRLSGTSMLELGLMTVQTADGQRVTISTDLWTKENQSSTGGEAAKIGGGAALGAIIGAIAGGGKGAAIGAGLGGGAGVGAAAATGGKPVELPSETIVRFRLRSKVTITERQM